MDRRWAIFVGAAGLALAVALGVALAPDTGPDPILAAPPSSPGINAARPVTGAEAERPRSLPPIRAPLPHREADPDRVHPPDGGGLGSATVERRSDLVACWQAYLDRGEPPTGRFTVQVTLPEGGTRVEAWVPNAPDDPELADCVEAALADARFEAPPEGAVSLVVPIPMSGPTDQ